MTEDTSEFTTCEKENATYQPARTIPSVRSVDSSLPAAQSVRSILTNRLEGEVRVRISASESRFPRSEKSTL